MRVVNDPKIVTVSGVSGAGKSTVMKRLMETGEFAGYMPSLTTRPPHGGDNEGEMVRVSPEEFARLEASGELLWSKLVHGHQYGTARQAVCRSLKASKPTLMVITPDYVPVLHNHVPDRVLPLYLLAPSPGEQFRRLRARGGLTVFAIRSRIEECKGWDRRMRTEWPEYFFSVAQGTPENMYVQVCEYLSRFLPGFGPP